MAIFLRQVLLCLGVCTCYVTVTVTAERTDEHLHRQLALDDDIDTEPRDSATEPSETHKNNNEYEYESEQPSQLAELASGDRDHDNRGIPFIGKLFGSKKTKLTWLCVLTGLKEVEGGKKDEGRCMVEFRYKTIEVEEGQEDNVHPGSAVCTDGEPPKKHSEPIDLTGPCCGGDEQMVFDEKNNTVYAFDDKGKPHIALKKGTCTKQQCLDCGAIEKRDKNGDNKVLRFLGSTGTMVGQKFREVATGFGEVANWKNVGKGLGALLAAEVGKIVVVGLFFSR